VFSHVYRVDIKSASYTRGTWMFTMSVNGDAGSPFALSVHGEWREGSGRSEWSERDNAHAQAKRQTAMSRCGTRRYHSRTLASCSRRGLSTTCRYRVSCKSVDCDNKSYWQILYNDTHSSAAPIYSIIHTPTPLICSPSQTQGCAQFTLFALDRVTPIGKVSSRSYAWKQIFWANGSGSSVSTFQCNSNLLLHWSVVMLLPPPLFIYFFNGD
jgi:hypothetical protein